MAKSSTLGNMALSSSGQDAPISGGNRGSNPLRATMMFVIGGNVPTET
jgi:hypothetical protein